MASKKQVSNDSYPKQLFAVLTGEDDYEVAVYNSLQELADSGDVSTGEEIAIYEMKERKVLRLSGVTLEDLPLVETAKPRSEK